MTENTICTSTTREEMLLECSAMIRHISANGLKMPQSAAVIIDFEHDGQIEIPNLTLIKIHQELSKAVSPAIPSSILYLFNESKKKKFLNFLGDVGLVRRMMLVSIFSLICFIALSLSSNVNARTVSEGILNNSGTVLLLNLLFFISAASMGASFSNLFQANKYIKERSYDPKMEITYWIKFIVGLMAGLIFAVLIPIREVESSKAMLSVPMLALLGGFSSNLTYKFIMRLVTTVETLLQGSESHQSSLGADKIKAELERNLLKKNNEFIGMLLDIKTSINHDSAKNVQSKIDQMIDELS